MNTQSSTTSSPINSPKTISINFSLAPYIYATTFENAIIILDGTADKYISLIDDAAKFLRLILATRFIQHENKSYYPESDDQSDNNDKYTYWISYFIEKKFIVHGSTPTILTKPLQDGGLKEYRWDTKKASWKPFSVAPFFDVFKAYSLLARVHWTIKHKGILGIITLIHKNTPSPQNITVPSHTEIQTLSASVDAASLLYPKQTLCLAWAATFTLLALRKKWKINFVIGIQTNPFYAHAWAETAAGTVINDDPLVAQALSVIFKAPYQH
jgi:hypothetical protein